MTIMERTESVTVAPRVRVEPSVVSTPKLYNHFGIDMWNEWFPDAASVFDLRKFAEIITGAEIENTTYVEAIQYLIKKGFRIDLDWKAEYADNGCLAQPGSPNAWPIDCSDYRVMFHKPRTMKLNRVDTTVYTPFPIRTVPTNEFAHYAHSFVIKISFRFESDYVNSIKAFYHEIKAGLIVMKAKREIKPTLKENRGSHVPKPIELLVQKYQHPHN